MKTKLLFTALLCLLLNQQSKAQLALGDIVFTGYQGDNIGNPSGEEDQFSFLLLKDVSTGDAISFTENGWLATGGFRTGESTLTLTFTSNYPSGTQMSISRLPFSVALPNGTSPGNLTGAGLSLVTSGDQIFAFDPSNVPNSNANQSGFIAAIQMNGDWDPDASSSTTSAKPSIFNTLANSSVAISPEVDNAIYNCSVTSGTPTQLRDAIQNPANWSVNGATPFNQPAPCSFINTLSLNGFTVSNKSFSISPNPVTSVLNFKSDKNISEVSVFNILGQKVIKTNTIVNNQLNMSELKAGIYLVNVTIDNTTRTIKVVKK